MRSSCTTLLPSLFYHLDTSSAGKGHLCWGLLFLALLPGRCTVDPAFVHTEGRLYRWCRILKSFASCLVSCRRGWWMVRWSAHSLLTILFLGCGLTAAEQQEIC
eukprot:Rmarinus@m.3466